ncbi:dienelactone hydrolase family protein [Umezawaea endophytica]|uniref:Dienelactone hydrolase family protein n=1 Tax=Umezawaea endophytica TaxID=1654476 RepID=A0A9X2VUC5_9PSEU|nr:dienelactone hydrolase family protein [Umezawaea endophytica]MCS7482885.1 dienelactone hydrolase family protein [Umezawaea endophytica]
MITEWGTVPTEDGPMGLYRAGGGAASAAVVVLQEAFGVNDHVQDVTRRFAASGYLAVAPDLFHRTGIGVLGYEQHAEAMPLIGAIDAGAITRDVRAVLAHLAAHDGLPASRVAVVGFCFGGRAAFTAATSIRGLGGTVVFYGPGIAAGPHAVLADAGRIDAPVLVHVGVDDPTIPADQVAAIDTALADLPVPARQFVYPDAGHAFACDARPALYRREAATLAWDRTTAFLADHVPLAD